MSFLGDFFNKRKAQNYKPVGNSRPLQMQISLSGFNNVVWTVASAENFIDVGYLGNHAIFSIQDWKSQKCATARPIVYRKRDEKTYQKYKSLMNQPTRDSFLAARDIKLKALEEITDHDMQHVLDFPNPYMSRYEFDYGETAYLDLTGNAYEFGVRDGSDGVSGRIVERYLPPAQNVQANMRGYEVVEYFLSGRPDQKIAAANVCHIRNWNPLARTEADRYSGLSRLHSLSHIIDSYAQSVEAEASIYQDKGVKMLVFPKDVKDVNEQTVEQKQSQRDRFNQQLREAGSGGIITSSVEVGSINLGFSVKDLGILESKALSKIDYCAAYHIPPELFGWGAHSAYQNLPTNRKIALTDAVLPEYEKRADKLNGWLTPSYDEKGKEGLVIGYNYDAFNELQPDKKELADWMESVPLTPNEIREAFGYGALKDENSNKIIISNKFKLLEDMGIDSFGAGDTTGLFGEDTGGDN